MGNKQRRVDDALLADEIESAHLAVTSGTRGVLVAGGDSLSRNSVVSSAIVDTEAQSFGSLDDRRSSSRLIRALDGAHLPTSSTFVATAANEHIVPGSLLRAGRLERVVRLGSSRLGQRISAWSLILEALGIEHGNGDLAKRLAMASPAYGLADFRHAVYTAVAESGSVEDVTFSGLLRVVESIRPVANSHLDFITYGVSKRRFISCTDQLNSATCSANAREALMCDWGEVGGYETVKDLMERLIHWPIMHSNTFHRLGVDAPRGFLLHGPSGSGKTLMVSKLLASLSTANWVSVDGPALFSKYLGDSEARVRALFAQARKLDPCIVFLDDVDSIGGNRGVESTAGVERRVLGALLAELDGTAAGQVFVVACTSDLSKVDPALYRSGRIDNVISVPLPTFEDRVDILKRSIRKLKDGLQEVLSETEVEKLASITEKYSGADLSRVCREAVQDALGRTDGGRLVRFRDFESAIERMK